MSNLENLQRIEAEIQKIKNVMNKLHSNKFVNNGNKNLLKAKIKALQLEAQCYIN